MTNPKSEKAQVTLDTTTIATCIVDHDVCPLVNPIRIGSKTVNAVIRKRQAVVRDRVNAVRFSIDLFDTELADAVRAYISSQICSFGTLKLETEIEKNKDGDDVMVVKSASLIEGTEINIGADSILDQMGIGDYVNVAYLMGKS